MRVYDIDRNPIEVPNKDLILGTCMGVRLKPRGKGDSHVSISLLTEDDENWFEKDFNVSSYWVDELIEVLTRTKIKMESECAPDYNNIDMRQYGWRFRTNFACGCYGPCNCTGAGDPQ